MGRGAVLALKITGDSRDGVRALDDADGAAGRFGGTMGKLAAGAGLAIGAIGALGKAGFDAASKLEQTTGGIDAVFGDWAVDIEQSAQKADRALGLSTSAYEELATVLGAQLKNSGMNIGDVTNKTQELITKGGDLAAVFGGTTADAVAALSSALKGEMDPIERYGVTLNQSAVDAKLAALGLDDLEGSAAQAAKTQAILGLITDQTTASVGAAGRESNTAASKTEQLSAMWENLKAKLGAGLLPLFVTAATFLQDRVAPALEKLTATGGPLSQMFGQVSGFITGQLVPALSSLWNEIAPKVLPILQTMGGIMTDHLVPAFRAVWGIVTDYVVPIFRTVLPPVIAGVKAVWDKISDALDRNRDKFSGLLENVRPLLEFLRDKVAPFVGGALKVGFEVLGNVISKVIDAIAWVLDKASAVGGFIGKVGSFVFGGPAPAAAAPVGGPRVLGAARGLFASTSPLGGVAGGGSTTSAQGLSMGDTINITVTGALDPAAVADQLAAMLDRRARRIGLVPAGAR
jgi:hypothetical protein